jgi:hypothetical protein
LTESSGVNNGRKSIVWSQNDEKENEKLLLTKMINLVLGFSTAEKQEVYNILDSFG